MSMLSPDQNAAIVLKKFTAPAFDGPIAPGDQTGSSVGK